MVCTSARPGKNRLHTKTKNPTHRLIGLIRRAVLNANEKTILTQIALTTGENPNCWPRVRTIAAWTSISERVIRQTIVGLEGAGLLRVDRRPGRSSRYAIDVQRLRALVPAPAPSEEPAADPSSESAPLREPHNHLCEIGRATPAESAGPSESFPEGSYQSGGPAFEGPAATLKRQTGTGIDPKRSVFRKLTRERIADPATIVAWVGWAIGQDECPRLRHLTDSPDCLARVLAVADYATRKGNNPQHLFAAIVGRGDFSRIPAASLARGRELVGYMSATRGIDSRPPAAQQPEPANAGATRTAADIEPRSGGPIDARMLATVLKNRLRGSTSAALPETPSPRNPMLTIFDPITASLLRSDDVAERISDWLLGLHDRNELPEWITYGIHARILATAAALFARTTADPAATFVGIMSTGDFDGVPAELQDEADTMIHDLRRRETESGDYEAIDVGMLLHSGEPRGT